MHSKKKLISLIIAAIAIIVGIIVLVIALQPKAPATTGDMPTYQTATPKGKPMIWERISPINNDPVYAYADKISGVDISVSEQPLPTSFINNTDSQIAQLATSYNANDIVNAGDTKVYIGTSIQGPQSVIFTKKSLLILIKSQVKIQDSAWEKYIESLS